MRPNCAGRSIEGVKQWVTVEARDAAVAAERERQLQGVHSAGVLQWIAVEAALPDDDITVLCWLSETCEWFAGWHEVDGWHDAAIGGPIVGVTHWADPDGPGTSASYADDRKRLIDRVERLRGLAKTAVGMLRDAGRDADAEIIYGYIGDMEAGALKLPAIEGPRT